MSSSVLLEVKGVEVDVGDRKVLSSTSLHLSAGESLAITGPSGSGKTTLLNCITGIRRPTAGSVFFDGSSFSEMSSSDRAEIRLCKIGLIFQDPELLVELSVLENAALRAIFQGVGRESAFAEARARLSDVGLADRSDDAVESLSGGEAQRVAIARAMVGSPPLIVADEPTASLDAESARKVTETVLAAALDAGAALVVATHDTHVAERCGAVMSLRDN